MQCSMIENELGKTSPERAAIALEIAISCEVDCHSGELKLPSHCTVLILIHVLAIAKYKFAYILGSQHPFIEVPLCFL